MKFVKDWERVKERWEAWWEGTLDKGPILSVYAPLNKPREVPIKIQGPQVLDEKWLDVEYRTKLIQNQAMGTWYGGDAVPSPWHCGDDRMARSWLNIGPGSIAAYLGSRPEFMPTTVWFNKLEDNSLDSIEMILHYNPDNEWWNITKELTRKVVDIAVGDFFTSFTDLGGALDILASLRGTQDLLIDLIDAPEQVSRCEERIMELWFQYYSELEKIIDESGQEGYTSWMPCWSASTWYPAQCDFGAMISPEMFKEFVVPRLRKQFRRLGHSIYHWDGLGQILHLDHLLAIDELDAIEWRAAAGNPPDDAEDWLPLYK